MTTITIPTGTILFRTFDPTKEDLTRGKECSDTGKTGKYFSNSVNLCLGMFFEYNDPKLILGVFRLKKDINCYSGKYSFRDIEPDHYFKDGKMIPYVIPKQSHNVSHTEFVYPIFDKSFGGDNLSQGFYNVLSGEEIFISEEDAYEFIQSYTLRTSLSEIFSQLTLITSSNGFFDISFFFPFWFKLFF